MTLTAMLCVLPLNAQERYLPIFDEGVRFYFTCVRGADTPQEFGYFECEKDVENENIYHRHMASYVNEGDFYYDVGGVAYEYELEVSNDNSKLWGRHRYDPPGAKDLLMDLDLNVGDKFKGFTVSKVYQKDGRKHVEFEELMRLCLYICTGENNEFFSLYHRPLIFVEGIGPNAFIEEYYSSETTILLYARHKNGEFEYGINGYPLRWFWVCEGPPDLGWCNMQYTCEKGTGLKETKISALPLFPNPSGDKVLVKLPETITGKAVLTISDLSGRNIETISVSSNSLVLDISHYAPATYIVKLSADNYQYTGKIIKK